MAKDKTIVSKHTVIQHKKSLMKQFEGFVATVMNV
jgi:hypothetical protein